MEHIRQAKREDLARVAEIWVTNYRLNFYPIFRDDGFYFGELQVPGAMEMFAEQLPELYVYDDGVVKGFACIRGAEIVHLFVEPALQGRGIGERMLAFAVNEQSARFLWALEKNGRAIRFYERHGFCKTGEKKLEEDTDEYLLKLSL